MKEAKKRLTALINQGEAFSYDNFATKSEHGYPEAHTPDWIAWTTRVRGAIENLFSTEAAPVHTLRKGLNVGTIGNGADAFAHAKNYLLAALTVASEIVTDDAFNQLSSADKATAPGARSTSVFVVHGHDDRPKTDLEMLLSEIGLNPIVLHRQPDEGNTLIEKLEKHSGVGYAFILLTPDEIAYLHADESKPENERAKYHRARPNVIFEFGFFVGLLGRANVSCLYTGDVEIPSDLAGLVYKRYNESVSEIAYEIVKELKAAGYKLKI